VGFHGKTLDDYLNYSFLHSLTTSVRANTEKPSKRQKHTHLTPFTFGRIQMTLGQPKTAGIKILFNSGSTQTHIKRDCIKKLRLQKGKTATWNTAAGPVDTTKQCKVLFSILEFSPTKVIKWDMHVGTFESINYDMIIGNNLLEKLKSTSITVPLPLSGMVQKFQ
jgi:hypothetical protein